jgi:hypothetical protein
MNYDPLNWYWLADDGRIYSSATQTIIDNTDANYTAWVNAGGIATVWPRDGSGNQTNASLQDVLTPYNLWVDLFAYAAYVRYNTASGGVIITSISPVAFFSDPVSRNTVDSANSYMTANPTATLQWKMSDGSWITVNQAQVTKMNNDIATFVHSCFTEESTLATGITGGTVTTKAQIDSGFAGISNTFP